MYVVGFEPTKHNALELESNPFDRSGIRTHKFIKKNISIHDGIRTRNLEIRSLTRYPIAPHRQILVEENRRTECKCMEGASIPRSVAH